LEGEIPSESNPDPDDVNFDFNLTVTQEQEPDLRTWTARLLLSEILRIVFHEDYSCSHEAALLPLILELFPLDVEDESIWRGIYENGSAFSEYVASRQKMAGKMGSVKDWLFHYENKSGNDNGLRLQFEAYKRSLVKKSAKEAAERKIKQAAQYTKDIPSLDQAIAKIKKEDWPEPETPPVPPPSPKSVMCSWCGKNPPTPGMPNCQPCQDEYNRNYAETFMTKKEQRSAGAP
jgi:hypothetical protein